MERLKAAFFLVLSLTVAVVGLLWLKDFSLKERYVYGAVFKSAGFLGNGDPVSLQGVNIGKIKRIDIYSDSVIVWFYIEGMRLKEGAFARIENEGLVGNRKLVIYQGDGKNLPERSVIRGEDTPTFADFVFMINEILSNLTVISARTDTTLRSANRLLVNTNRELLRLSKDLRELISSTRDLADNANSKVDVVSYQLLRIANRLDETVSVVDSFVRSSGTVQRLMTEDSLYVDLSITLKEIRELVKDIRTNPQRYINVNVKLF